MKNFLYTAVAIILFTPVLAWAIPSSIDRITDHIEPLIKTDYIKATSFTASSTSATSTFPISSLGTTTITNKFTVTGTGTSTFAGGINTGANMIISHGGQADASDGWYLNAGNGTQIGLFGAGNTSNALFYGALNIDGNTRIATTTNGVLTATAGAITASGTPYVTSIVATGTTATSTFAGAVGIGTTTPLSLLTVQGTANVTSNFQVNGGTLFVDAGGNSVGIGTTTPVNQMSIVSSAVRTPYISFFDHLGNRAIDIISATSSTASSTAFGLESLKSVTTATGLTAFGSGALRANTTGNSNTAFGSWALRGVTSGGNNTAIGLDAGQAVTTGGTNTSLGSGSIRQTTSGSRNIGIGYQALYANTIGASNIAIGNTSARYLADGVTTNIGATSSIYLGHNILSASAGSLNEIVIGNYLTGNGTNTATFGDSSLSTLFAGKVGIGTTTPTYPLSVADSAYIGGSLTLLQALKDSTNATGSSNQILTSTGTSTLWTTPSSLCVAITGSADLCDGSDGGGGGGGGALSTTTDIIGVPTSTPQEVSYVTGDVMFGGNSSTTAEFQLDDDGAQLIISAPTTSATATIQSGGSIVEAIRIGDDSGVGLEYIFSTAGKIITRFYGSITEWIMDLAKVAITGKLYVATTTYNGATTSDAIVADGPINTGEWMYMECSSAFGESGQIASADVNKGCNRFSYIEDTNGVLDIVSPNTGTSTYFRIRTGVTGTTNVAGDGMGIGTYDKLYNAYIDKYDPVMEWVWRTDGMANATSAIFIGGFTTLWGPATDFATEPTQGIYVIGTSTTANWQLACNPPSGSTTYIDTGIATTTVTSLTATTNNPFVQWRLEASGETSSSMTAILKARTTSNRNLNQVASCVMDMSTSISIFAPTISSGRTSAGTLPAELHVMWLKFWYRHTVF